MERYQVMYIVGASLLAIGLVQAGDGFLSESFAQIVFGTAVCASGALFSWLGFRRSEQ